jgi:hypothetical protein
MLTWAIAGALICGLGYWIFVSPLEKQLSETNTYLGAILNQLQELREHLTPED